MRGKAPRVVFEVARENRKEITPAEQKLWDALRGRKLDGLKFRKQHPCDRYILDFYCVEQMLAMEVDGSIHNVPENKELDQERTMALREKGIRLLRFSNQEVLQNIDTVLERIIEFVQKNSL